ncbi:MAG TPA: hypothetical protein VMN39_09155 [Longimicrobiaceae bacterium]|nr:hypothetical protein [Longimicrobiaceae bacterium]
MTNSTAVYPRALLVWIGLAAAMVANGVARDFFYLPYVGFGTAQALSSVIGIAIILAIARLFVLAHPATPHRHWARIGILWGALMIAFEVALGRFVSGLAWRDILANYNLFAGRLWPLVLLTVFLAPVFWSRRLYRRRSADLYFRA